MFPQENTRSLNRILKDSFGGEYQQFFSKFLIILSRKEQHIESQPCGVIQSVKVTYIRKWTNKAKANLYHIDKETQGTQKSSGSWWKVGCTQSPDHESFRKFLLMMYA